MTYVPTALTNLPVIDLERYLTKLSIDYRYFFYVPSISMKSVVDKRETNIDSKMVIAFSLTPSK